MSITKPKFSDNVEAPADINIEPLAKFKTRTAALRIQESLTNNVSE